MKMSGDLWKLYTLDNSAEPDAFDTFRGLFKGWTWLEDAGDTTVGGTIKERGRWIVFGD